MVTLPLMLHCVTNRMRREINDVCAEHFELPETKYLSGICVFINELIEGMDLAKEGEVVEVEPFTVVRIKCSNTLISVSPW